MSKRQTAAGTEWIPLPGPFLQLCSLLCPSPGSAGTGLETSPRAGPQSMHAGEQWGLTGLLRHSLGGRQEGGLPRCRGQAGALGLPFPIRVRNSSGAVRHSLLILSHGPRGTVCPATLCGLGDSCSGTPSGSTAIMDSHTQWPPYAVGSSPQVPAFRYYLG